jgi:hypothetical protein
MLLKITTSKNRVRRKQEVRSFDEAKKLIGLHAKPTDKSYVIVASDPERQKQFAENGRLLSKREIKNLKNASRTIQTP